MRRFLVFDYAYGNCKGDTRNFLADGAAHEIDAVREMCARNRRFPLRFDLRAWGDFPPHGYSECFVVFTVPHDSTIDPEGLNFEENDAYLKRRGGEMCGMVFVFDSLDDLEI